MTFFKITQKHPYLDSIRDWYIHAFPIDERRTFDDLTRLLACSDMNLCGLVSDTRLVGFILYWQWEDIVFVEHFAIDPDQRGNQLGQQALAVLARIPCRYCLLEVENPADAISRRRIQFYERQGFCLQAFDYVQPPYQPEKPAVPMRLMSRPAMAHEGELTSLVTLIKHRVYERFYPFM